MKIYIVHMVDINQFAIDIDYVDVIEQQDDTHFVVETTEEGEKGPVLVELGFDAALTLKDAIELVIQTINVYLADGLEQLKRAFERALNNAETLDGSSGEDGLTESEYIAREGALVNSIFYDLSFSAQMCLIKFMRLAREEAD